MGKAVTSLTAASPVMPRYGGSPTGASRFLTDQMAAELSARSLMRVRLPTSGQRGRHVRRHELGARLRASPFGRMRRGKIGSGVLSGARDRCVGDVHRSAGVGLAAGEGSLVVWVPSANRRCPEPSASGKTNRCSSSASPSASSALTRVLQYGLLPPAEAPWPRVGSRHARGTRFPPARFDRPRVAAQAIGTCR
jgi:hypothetical protein